MSSSVKDRPSGGDNSGGGGGDDGRSEKDQKLCTFHGRKSKRVSLFRFRRRNRSSSPAISGGGGVRGGGRLCLCFKPTPTSDSLGESQASDPNSSEFKFEFLKGLIEKNDFWSKECNTHLDLQIISSSIANCDDNL